MNTSIQENVSETCDCIEYPEYVQTISFIYLIFILIFGGLGNALVIFIQVKNKQKSSTDSFVLAMAASDLMCSVVVVPLYIVQYGDNWDRIAGDSFCQGQAFLVYISSILSTFLLTLTSIERYAHTRTSVNAPARARRAPYVCAAVCATSLLLAVPAFWSIYYDSNEQRCSQNKSIAQIFVNFVFGFTYVAMFAVVGFCYTKIAIMLRQHQRVKALLRLNMFRVVRPAYNSNKVFPQSADEQNQPTPSSTRITTETVSKTASPNYKHSLSPRNQQTHSLVTESSVRVNTLASNHLPVPTVSTLTSHEIAVGQVLQNHNNHNDAEWQKINRTTLVMFLITIVYILSWTIFVVVIATATVDTEQGRVVIHLARTLYLINCVTNPVFYMSLSSKFRKNTKEVFFNMFFPVVR